MSQTGEWWVACDPLPPTVEDDRRAWYGEEPECRALVHSWEAWVMVPTGRRMGAEWLFNGHEIRSTLDSTGWTRAGMLWEHILYRR